MAEFDLSIRANFLLELECFREIGNVGQSSFTYLSQEHCFAQEDIFVQLCVLRVVKKILYIEVKLSSKNV